MADDAKQRAPGWDQGRVRALRVHLGYTQGEMAREMGVRQQTISEWETGMYRPRGSASTLLHIIAERAGFRYTTAPDPAGSLQISPAETAPTETGPHETGPHNDGEPGSS